ncbi:MAG: DUF4395 family protein [Patescibacteria group bacterium]|nr:DUF4395 family protein [Patescibacteria group bacterium]
MNTCSIYDKSLRFSRAVYGGLTVVAFLIHGEWLLLLVCVLMALGTFSLKLNLFYQLHYLVFVKMGKKSSAPIQKESGELSFVSGMTAMLLFIGFLLIHFNIYADFAWIYILVVAFLIFLACFVGLCLATLMYVFFKKIFKKQ